MESEIIQKEKDRQDSNLYQFGQCPCSNCRYENNEHKQSLINLKEYMEEQMDFIMKLEGNGIYETSLLNEKIDTFRNELEEITKMIERYK